MYQSITRMTIKRLSERCMHTEKGLAMHTEKGLAIHTNLSKLHEAKVESEYLAVALR